MRFVSLNFGNGERSSCGHDQDAGMAMKDPNDIFAQPNLPQHQFGHLNVSYLSDLLVFVILAQIDDIGIEFSDVRCGNPVRGVVKDNIRRLDMTDRLERHVRYRSHAGSDQDEAAGGPGAAPRAGWKVLHGKIPGLDDSSPLVPVHVAKAAIGVKLHATAMPVTGTSPQ